MRKHQIIKFLKQHFDRKLLKKEIRKIEVNFITTGMAGTFITHIAGLTPLIVAAATGIILVGSAALFLGAYRGTT